MRSEAFDIVVVAVGAEREESFLKVCDIITKVRPRFAVCVLCESVINCCDVGWGIYVCHVGAKVKEIRGRNGWVPVQLLPGIRWVVERATDCIQSAQFKAIKMSFDLLGNAIVMAKSLISVKASSPNSAFSSEIALVLFAAIRVSILTIMSLMLAMQS